MTDVPPPSRSRRALLLLNLQEDFLAERGRLPVHAPQVAPMLAAVCRSVAMARWNGGAVIAVGSEFRPGDHLMNLVRRNAAIAGSPGARWTQAVPLDGIDYFAKSAACAFANPNLERWLHERQVQTLAIAGLTARGCVMATATSAMSLGYRVELIADAIACTGVASRRRALGTLLGMGALIVRSPGAVRLAHARTEAA